MSVIVTMAECPSCGAPIAGKVERRHAICIFCNTSLTLAGAGRSPDAAAAVAQEVSSEGIERVKQLLVDGKPDEAIALYASLASVSREEAERAMEHVFVSSIYEMSRDLPINPFGFVLHGFLVALGLGPVVWGALSLGESPYYGVLVVVGAAWVVWRLRSFGRQLVSTWVNAFGATGRARVLRRALIREMKERDGYYIVVLFEVVPDDGSATFVDQETLYVGPEAFAKLVPNHVVPVRYDGARAHVFPISPVTVIG